MLKLQPIFICGAGTFGLSTAYHLSLKGYRNITVFDRKEPPTEDAASTDINKIIRSDYGNDLLYQEMAIESMIHFRDWNDQERGATVEGRKLFHEVGVLLAGKEGVKDTYETQSLSTLLSSGHKNLVSNSDLEPSTFPFLKDLRKRYPGGYLNKEGGWADSSLCIKFMARLCRDSGVKIITGDAGTLTKLLRSPKDKTTIDGLQMKDGSRYLDPESTIILAMGAWTASLCPETSNILLANGQPVIHIELPLSSPLRNSPSSVWAVLGTEGYYGFPPKDGIAKIARHGDGYIFPSASSKISTPKTVLSHPRDGSSIPLRALEDFKTFLKENFPVLARLPITATRMCWYTDTADGDFYICPLKGQKERRVILATGGSGHAFKFLPVIGSVVVDVLEGRETPRTKRFAWRDPPPLLLSKEGTNKKKESSRSGVGKNDDLNTVQLAKPSDLREKTSSKL